MAFEALALISLFILGFGVISGRLERTVITPPMIFVLFGMSISGFLEVNIDNEIIRILAEFTLVIVLFTDASRIQLSLLRREYGLALRLLGIGLPLTILFGTLIAAVMFDVLSLLEAAIVATILAPTDAALGQAVVSSPHVPIKIRQTLNVESGLNDGIAVPVITILLALLLAESSDMAEFARFTAGQIILGPLVGIIIGYVGGQLVMTASERHWMNHSFEQLSALAISIAAFAFADVVGGNGFMAAFFAGLTLGNTARDICDVLAEFGEAEGQLLTLLTFLIFGAVMVLPALEAITPTLVLYGVLSLTLIRMLGVVMCLLGMNLQRETIAFLGWFGPRGLASIIFAILAVEEGIPAGETILHLVVITILMSIFAHGLTALPAAKWYGRHAEDMDDMAEMETITEMPVRINYMPE